MAKPVIYKSKSVKDAKTKREVYDVTDTETCLDIMFDSDINDPYHHILQNIETVIIC